MCISLKTMHWVSKWKGNTFVKYVYVAICHFICNAIACTAIIFFYIVHICYLNQKQRTLTLLYTRMILKCVGLMHNSQ